MSVYELRDPLTRLSSLPTMMNWRSVWGNADQYYKNDVAVSPTNNASYLLFGATTDAGQDPIGNPAWFELFPHTTGLHQLVAGNGIQITPVPAPDTPTITNTGVRTLQANTGLAWSSPTLTNTGVLRIVADPSSTSGLYWDASASTLFNVGVLATTRVGFANTGTPQNQVWSNQGITALNAGANISVSVDSSGTATIGNTGVVSLVAGSNIVIGNGGTPLSRSITLKNIDTNTILTPTAGMTPQPITGSPLPLPPLPNGAGFVPVSLPVGNSLIPMLTNPPLDPNPTWVFDFGGWWVDAATVQGISLGLIMGLRDTATAGGPYYYLADENVWLSDPLGARAGANCGLMIAPLHDIRSAGLQTITDVFLYNQTGNFLTLTSWSPVQATYYANYST